MFLLEWHTPDGDFIYGYKTKKELMRVIDTFTDKPYIRYTVYQVNSMQKMIFLN